MEDILFFNDDGTKVIGVKNKSIKSVTIPEGVKTIGEYAFLNCKSLQEIILPWSLEAVEKYAFSGCKKLCKVCFYESIKYIGERCFNNCSSLNGVFISGSIETICKEAFFNCSNLNFVYLMSKKPASITIGPDWFMPANFSCVTIYIPLSTFNEYNKISAFKRFNLDFNSRFDADIFMDLFPNYTTLSLFVSLSEISWPSCIKDNLQIAPDYESKGIRFLLKKSVRKIQKSEAFYTLLNKYYLTKEDVLKRWSHKEVCMFLPKGVTLVDTLLYSKEEIDRIEKSGDFIIFRKNPLNWILNEISKHKADGIFKRINSSFFNIPSIPEDDLIQKAYAQYRKRIKGYISLEDFKNNESLCVSYIMAYLRHVYTEYDTIMKSLDRYYYSDEEKESFRDILHIAIDNAIANIYPRLGSKMSIPVIRFIV